MTYWHDPLKVVKTVFIDVLKDLNKYFDTSKVLRNVKNCKSVDCVLNHVREVLMTLQEMGLIRYDVENEKITVLNDDVDLKSLMIEIESIFTLIRILEV